MDDEAARLALERMIAERGEDYASLSRLIGRNAAYVQQYIKRGTPRRLAEEDRRVLARYFGVGEQRLGATGVPSSTRHVAVPRVDV
ncbi:MAG: peptidase S24, partial [Pseudomonadota bacterium]|nr:peptidase S24 [Pseudomonadota bacterium]